MDPITSEPERGIKIHEKLVIPFRELVFSASRSSGPGGQNVNKVNSRITLRWNVMTSTTLLDADRQQILSRIQSKLTRGGELIISSDEHRDQRRNREECISRFRKLVRSALRRERPRIATKPSRAKIAKRLDEKKHQGQKKQARKRAESDE